MSLSVDLHVSDLLEAEKQQIPSQAKLTEWADNAYRQVGEASEAAEVSLRIVDETEMAALNQQYRNKTGGTNVLSFTVDLPEEVAAEISPRPLGDIVICHSIVCDESQQQQKSINDHYAHMVTHSVLHLFGYDHQDDEQANQMEAIEANALAKIGISNPYS